jgi:hypothetical protein
VLTLTYYSIKRLARHRAIVLTLVALPLATGLARLAFARAGWSHSLTWIGPAGCAIVTAAAFYLQHRDDAASGLLDTLASTPTRSSAPAFSRVVAGFLVFCLQAALLAAVLSTLNPQL